jgi:hypothetical protein
MTTHTTTTDYAHEKQEVQYVEDAQDSPIDSSHELQKERTLEGIDMNNSFAVKGDDSDGKVSWNLRSMFAAVFLAALYTGKSAPEPLLLPRVDPRQDHRSSFILREVHLVLLRKTLDSHVALRGSQPPTS